MAVAVQDVSSSKSLFSFGCILESKQSDTGFIYLKLKENIGLEPYSMARHYKWSEVHHLFDVKYFQGSEFITRKQVFFLNQITGVCLFGLKIDKQSIINNKDNCYQFSTKGPDKVLPMYVYPRTIKKLVCSVSVPTKKTQPTKYDNF